MNKASYVNLAELTKKNVALAKYIRDLQNHGKLKKYLDGSGRLCYSVEEYENYKKTAKRGRPAKNAIVLSDGDVE